MLSEGNVVEEISAPSSPPKGVEELVRDRLEESFRGMEREDFKQVLGLYDMVVKKADAAVIKFVMERTGGNQVHSAAILGINRNTLRKRLREYGLL